MTDGNQFMIDFSANTFRTDGAVNGKSKIQYAVEPTGNIFLHRLLGVYTYISSARKLVLKSWRKSIVSVSWLLITSRIC